MEQVIEPPKPDELEKEMRKDTDKHIQFVVWMLPPVYGKDMWNGIVVKTNLSEFVIPSQEAFALLLYKNGYRMTWMALWQRLWEVFHWNWMVRSYGK